jgi:hypothetical protein
VDIKANDGKSISNETDLRKEVHGMKKDDKGNALAGAQSASSIRRPGTCYDCSFGEDCTFSFNISLTANTLYERLRLLKRM